MAVLMAIAIVAAAPVARSQQAAPGDSSIRVEASPQVFATMCALEAAGFNIDESTIEQMPALTALRADLIKTQGPATQALREFYRDHALADPAETLSQYMTFALAVGPPPEFQFQTDRDSLPPGVLTIEGFRVILANFYREAHLEVAVVIDGTTIRPGHSEVPGFAQTKLFWFTNGYLREIAKPADRRTFVVDDLNRMVGARTNFRNSGDAYSIVVGTTSQTAVDAIQHAYLHFMLDPMMLRNRSACWRKKRSAI